MNKHDKRKKAAIIAASYYILQQSDNNKPIFDHAHWLKVAKEMHMTNRTWIQSRGRFH